MRLSLHACLAPALALLISCASAGSTPPPNTTPGEYRIGPEDLIEIVVWNNDALSRRVPVRPDGMISLPLVNDVRAAGLTPMELRDQLRSAFSKFISQPDVYVIVQEINSPKVAVVGEVARPGRYVIKAPITVLDLIAEAGGLTEFATGSNAVVMRTRGGRIERFHVDARAADATDAGSEIHLEPGDVVVVP